MKRVLSAALTACLWTGIAGGLPSSYANARLDVHTASETNAATWERPNDWRQDQCRFDTRDGIHGWSVGEVKSTLRCAERKWSTDLDLAFRIVGCESGFDAHAQNSRSSAGGVWQSLDSTFDSWVSGASSLMDRWEMRDRQLNGRTNAVLGLRVLANGGTGPWSASQWCWG